MRASLLLGATPFIGALFLAPAETRAGAFQIREGSAAAQGSSLSGRTSGDRDATYALHNPAALRTVEHFEAGLGLSAIIATGEADVTTPLGRSTDDPNEIAAVPSAIAGWRLNRHVVFGLAIDAPFGLATRYSSDWAGRFDAVDSELTNVTVTPLVALQPVEDVAFGFGLTLSYADARLTNVTASGRESELQGDDFALGFTVGALADIGPRTTIGAAFISPVEHRLEGAFSGAYTVPGVGVLDGPGAADLSLPAIVSLGITHGFSDDFRMMAEFEFIGWSAFESIDAYSSAADFTLRDPQNYDDAFMVAVGGEYDLSERLTLRGGVAFDRTPTNDAFRTPRVPDADRYWVSAGASYEITERVGIDAAYTLVLFDETSLTLKRTPGGGAVDYNDSMAHVVSLNTRFRF